MTESLLHRVAQGDPQSVGECIDRFGGLIWSLARRFLGNPAEAEDAVQEVFIELWRHAGRYNASVSSETTFVTMIARRRFIDRRRKQSRRADSEAVNLEDLPLAASDCSQLDVDTRDEARLAVEAMDELRPEVRKVLLLAVCEGWSHQAIADRLKLPLGTVKTHVRRGLIRVRDSLKAERAARESGKTS